MKVYYLERITNGKKEYYTKKHKWCNRKTPRLFTSLAGIKQLLGVMCGTRFDARKDPDNPVIQNPSELDDQYKMDRGTIKCFDLDLDTDAMTFDRIEDIGDHNGVRPEYANKWHKKLNGTKEQFMPTMSQQKFTIWSTGIYYGM